MWVNGELYRCVLRGLSTRVGEMALYATAYRLYAILPCACGRTALGPAAAGAPRRQTRPSVVHRVDRYVPVRGSLSFPLHVTVSVHRHGHPGWLGGPDMLRLPSWHKICSSIGVRRAWVVGDRFGPTAERIRLVSRASDGCRPKLHRWPSRVSLHP